MVSIIVPVYKVEDYLAECVNSMIAQTYRDIEIILVDDGSPDRCPEMCDEFAEQDNRIRVVHKENGGLSSARNAGIKVAMGELIAFVDSDDYVDDRFIETLVKALHDTEADIAAVNIVEFSDKAPLKQITHADGYKELTQKQAFMEIQHNGSIKSVVWNKIYRTKLVKSILFEEGRLHEDEFFTTRMLQQVNRIAFIEDGLYFYRQREGSIMSSFNSKLIIDGLDANMERASFLYNAYPDLYLDDYLNICLYCLNCYELGSFCATDDSRDALNKLLQARKGISLPAGDWLRTSWKDKFYIIATHPLLLPLVSFLRYQISGRKRCLK